MKTYKDCMNSSLAFGVMASFINHSQPIPVPPRPEYTSDQLRSEYELIMQKKSKLTKSQRDRVVYLYSKLAGGES